ncbi:hypothetical protein HY522_06315 [bacterium]|nr:hypothetical protein [bacterium]
MRKSLARGSGKSSFETGLTATVEGAETSVISAAALTAVSIDAAGRTAAAEASGAHVICGEQSEPGQQGMSQAGTACGAKIMQKSATSITTALFTAAVF